MAQTTTQARVSTAGKSRKSHLSRKQGAEAPLGPGESSTQAIATTEPSAPPDDKPALPPWWKRDRGGKSFKLWQKVEVMRAAGRTCADIAKKLGYDDAYIQNLRYIARKNGWVDENDEPIDLEVELALDIDRKTVRNISDSLDGQMTNWQTHEMTLAAAKGRGIFKNHDTAAAPVAAQTVVAVQVVMPTVGSGDQQVDEKSIGGTPAYIEGETL